MSDQSIILDPAQRSRDLRNEVRRRLAARRRRQAGASDAGGDWRRGQVVPFPARPAGEPRDAR